MLPIPIPFALIAEPDSTDWPSFWVNLVIAVATVATLIWAVISTRSAQEDAKGARQEADAAAKQRDERRKRDELRDLAHERAMRQAAFVSLEPSWYDLAGSNLDPLYPGVRVIVHNASMQAITDVKILWEHDQFQGGIMPDHPATVVTAKGERSTTVDLGMVYMWPLTRADLPPVSAEFTDVHRDRWRLDLDGRLRLLNLRDIDVAEF